MANRIRYRVVDEYNGETLSGKNTRNSIRRSNAFAISRQGVGKQKTGRTLAIGVSVVQRVLSEVS